jgi:hypothetical protein
MILSGQNRSTRRETILCTKSHMNYSSNKYSQTVSTRMMQFTMSIGAVGRGTSSLVPVHAGAYKRIHHTGLVSADVRKSPYSELLFVCTCTVGAVTGDGVRHRHTCRPGPVVTLECVFRY